MTTAQERPDEQKAHRELVAMQEQVEDLRQKWVGPPPSPKGTSPLWWDDRESRPYQVSHAAWAAVGHAIDHLVAAYDLTVQQEGPTHYNITTRPYAVYPMLRASFENATRALWLVGGETQEMRIERRFRLAYTDARMSDLAHSKLTGTQTTRAKEFIDLIRPIAVNARVSLTSIREEPKFSEIVRDGAAVTGMKPNVAEVLWRCLSALAHGEYWAVLALLDRDEIATSPDGKTVTLLTSSNANTVVSFMTVALNTTRAAAELYGIKATKLFQIRH